MAEDDVRGTEQARVIVFDTTLRDGEQSPGATLTADEKLEVADALVELGVDVMEAGFPAASPGDFEAVRAIANRVKGVTVAGLARCNESDIERAAMAVKGAESARIHTFIATSDIHLKHKLRMSSPRGAGARRSDGAVRQGVHRGRGVLRGRRDALGLGVPGAGLRRGDRGGRDDDQCPGYRRLHLTARVRGAHGIPHRDRARMSSGPSSPFIATTTSAWPRRTRWPRCEPGRGKLKSP